MPKCTSKRHFWTDPDDAERCCNGWHRELRLRHLLPGDRERGRPHLLTTLGVPAWQVWVPDKAAKETK